MTFKKGQSGNPAGRKRGTGRPREEREWFKHLRIAAKREVTVELPPTEEEITKAAEEGRPVKREKRTGTQMALAADAVFKAAREGNMLATEHLANRFDGRVRDEVEITHSASLKVKYESLSEVEEALRAEGIDPDRLPLLGAPSDPADLELIADEVELDDEKHRLA
jgi:hypothetical protein